MDCMHLPLRLFLSLNTIYEALANEFRNIMLEFAANTVVKQYINIQGA